MKDLYSIFLSDLTSIRDCEEQISKALPKLVKASSFGDLKQALNLHLEETREQLNRANRIFSLLEVEIEPTPCEAMKEILKPVPNLAKVRSGSAILDANIIAVAQKVEHYEIAAYSSLVSFAKNLGLKTEITDLLEESLNEENSASKALTKLADGSFFSHSINREAALLSKP